MSDKMGRFSMENSALKGVCRCRICGGTGRIELLSIPPDLWLYKRCGTCKGKGTLTEEERIVNRLIQQCNPCMEESQ